MRTEGAVGVIVIIFGLATFLLGFMISWKLMELAPHFRGILVAFDLKSGLHTEATYMPQYDLLTLISFIPPTLGILIIACGIYLVAKGIEQKK